MLACSSPQLFAACHVLLRRMVPWHPPCALCSLIFSSLDPETNCSLLFSYVLLLIALAIPRKPHYSVRNWPFLNHFFLLCSCQGAALRSATLAFAQQASLRSVFGCPSPENDTGFETLLLNSSSVDALGVFCVTHSLSVHARALSRFLT